VDTETLARVFVACSAIMVRGMRDRKSKGLSPFGAAHLQTTAGQSGAIRTKNFTRIEDLAAPTSPNRDIPDAPCPACGSTSSRSYLTGCRDLLCGVDGEWTIQECLSCGLLFTIPRSNDEQIAAFYPQHYPAYHPPEGVKPHSFLSIFKWAASMPYRIRFGSPELRPTPFGHKRFLDVGCGGGALLSAMQALGWSCFGIDLSEESIRASRKRAPQAFVKKALLQDLCEESFYDLIVLSHVLEHLPNPISSLHHCLSLLRPGGKLVVVVPNIASAEAKLFSRSWLGLEIPRHLIHFTERTAKNVIERAGFQIENVRPSYMASSISQSILLSAPSRWRQQLLHSSLSRILHLLCLLPANLSYLLGNRGAVEITARKPDAAKPTQA
jgi:SAM-dependent methyltransferase